MQKRGPGAGSVDTYIATFPVAVRERLELVRQTIRKVVPEAQEKISYGIPTFTLDGNLIHYAAFRNHIGIYPGSAAIKAFRKDLAAYKTSKGTIQLPADAPIPCALIER
ncbi:MAG TPA: DUF1801 domain-containing protein, partial [Woeseiaceae bacterium]|nr:DUF1801 domain-containing protein [Woeseiaceae bacterium]